MVLYKTKESKVVRVDGSSNGHSLKKFSTSITGDGVTNVFNIEHNLDTEDIIFEMYDGAEPALIDYTIVDKNNVTITFDIAPGTVDTFSIKIYGVLESNNAFGNDSENNKGDETNDEEDQNFLTTPETIDVDWDYTLHEDTNTVTLNYYKGTAKSVKVYSYYKLSNGKTYKTEIASNTDNKYSNYMFAGKYFVENIVFSKDLDTSSCTDMQNMFYLCDSLTNLDIRYFNTDNVTNMSAMFASCFSLTNLDLSNFNTTKVTDISFMFTRCRDLQNINIDNFDTSNVTNIANMFSECKKLQSININNFNTSKVTNMNSMFDSCEKLEILDLTGFYTSNVNDMKYMFRHCKSLTEIIVKSGKWITSQANTEDMFNNCGVSSVTYV